MDHDEILELSGENNAGVPNAVSRRAGLFRGKFLVLDSIRVQDYTFSCRGELIPR